MSESLRINPPLRGLAMPEAYSCGLWERVMKWEASPPEVAERFQVTGSRWLQRWREAKSPRRGRVIEASRAGVRAARFST
jgi:hypothetical protein